jgi:membrane protein DedA with SNARE-associated domain
MHLIHEYGLLAVAAIIGLECLGLPLPGETALLAAAIYAGTKTDLNINSVIVTGAGAAMAGRMIGYLIGHKFGSRLLLRYGHYVGLTTGRIKLGQYLFMRYGGKIIFFAQFVPVLRTLAGPFAGANLMPWRKFMFANAISSGLWGSELWLCRILARRRVRTTAGSDGSPAHAYSGDGPHCRRLFVRRREAQLIIEAEHAIPGSLEPH